MLNNCQLNKTPFAIFLDKIMDKFKISTKRAAGVFLDIPESKISEYVRGIRKPGYKRCLKIQSILRKYGVKIDVYDIRPEE